MRKMARKVMSIELADTLNAYQATGRVATVFPYLGKISLSGHPSIPYTDALAVMQFCLRKEGRDQTGEETMKISRNYRRNNQYFAEYEEKRDGK